MSLNSLAIPASTLPSLLPGEDYLTPGNTADIELRIPATIQGPKRTEYAKGRVWATNQRVRLRRGGSHEGLPTNDRRSSLSRTALTVSLLCEWRVDLHVKYSTLLVIIRQTTLTALPCDPLHRAPERDLPAADPLAQPPHSWLPSRPARRGE
ncbi:hypothetical protein P7C73_g6712, partial [Tremellales sp. Uapishka_1]